jgi:hypothetical protein
VDHAEIEEVPEALVNAFDAAVFGVSKMTTAVPA